MVKVDVAVVGAGLNGLVAALALGGGHSPQPLTVAVLDRFDPRRMTESKGDSRASALTAASQAMFTVLGLWDAVKPYAQDMKQIVVTDGQNANQRPCLLNFGIGEGEPAAAAMVENHHLYAAALAGLERNSNVQLVFGNGLKSIQYGHGLADIRLADETQIKASLVIGADGRNSMTSQAAGLKLQGWNYAQSAITLTVAHEVPHGGIAEEHFTPTGVFAILPLVGNRSSLVWTEPHGEARRIVALDDTAFLAELSKRFGTHRGVLSLASQRHVHPLSMILSDELIAGRLALIGDAAHVLHPLAGLGLNLGFKDVAALVDCVKDAQLLGQDIGGADVLERYARWRRFDIVATAYLLDGMNRLFANDHGGLRMLRDAGLKLVDHSRMAKQFLMNEAAGKTGDLPRLMRGLAA